ncbi:hypothetical protein [Micromonospora sp. NPDC049679]|uniref:hypothetical protein n=1 Tax=Micromonospora sp. NPDC049679 TaxID=3155920 RepID=UPI0033DC61D1
MARPGNTEGWPDDLPELPPGWGPVVIPDDPAELAAEAVLVRAELRREALLHDHGQPVGARASAPAPDAPEPMSLRLSLLIMAITVLTTLASLFAVTWSGPQRRLVGQTGPPGGSPTIRSLPALEVVDANGVTVPLRGLLPAVIMLTDRCSCPEQIAATAAAAPTGVTVVTVTIATSPSPAVGTGPSGAPVRALADPTGELRASVKVTASRGTPTVLLVDAAADIVRLVPASSTAEEYRADLALLAGR